MSDNQGDDAADRQRVTQRVQTRYDELRAAAKHGIYETIFQIVHEERDAVLRDARAKIEMLVDPARYGLDKYEAENALANAKANKEAHKKRENEWRRLHEASEGL